MFNKKGVSEIVSFVLITLLIVISANVAFLFAKDKIIDTVEDLDLKNIISLFEKSNVGLIEIQTFDKNSFTVPVSFRTGNLHFENDTVYYQSLVPFYGDSYCINDVCHVKNGKTELVSFNLTNGYNFSENIELTPGNYRLFFRNNKNEKKIEVKFR